MKVCRMLAMNWFCLGCHLTRRPLNGPFVENLFSLFFVGNCMCLFCFLIQYNTIFHISTLKILFCVKQENILHPIWMLFSKKQTFNSIKNFFYKFQVLILWTAAFFKSLIDKILLSRHYTKTTLNRPSLLAGDNYRIGLQMVKSQVNTQFYPAGVAEVKSCLGC